MWIKKRQLIGISILFIVIINIPFQGLAQIQVSENTSDLQNTHSESIGNSAVYRAVLVGIDDYYYQPLPYSVKQILDFKNTLVYGGNWDESNIFLFTDSYATKDAIVNQLSNIEEVANENDVTLFYFAGHGGRNFTNEFIRTYDNPIYDVELDQYLINISGNVIVLVDSCYSGGFIEDLERSGRMIITACAKDEITYQVMDLESGMFGYFFNLCLSWITKKAENTFMLTQLFTWFYGKKLSRELNREVSINPQIYNGISDSTYLIESHAYVNKITELFLPMIQINANSRVWEMNN